MRLFPVAKLSPFLLPNTAMGRGALIVFEGGDKSGKTTQCAMLAEAFRNQNVSMDVMRFPERTTLMGSLINEYLTRKSEMEDQVIHLLFSANRWELMPIVRKKLLEETNVVIDRYAYSGVAFSTAKGLNFDWCKQPDVGLPKPDLVVFLDVSAEVAETRGEFGGERYETASFQEKVRTNYLALKDETWVVIDAKKSVEAVHNQVRQACLDVITNVRLNNLPISTLWTK